MPKRKSEVWEHFDEIEKGKKAKCVYCPQFISITGGSFSNLARHTRKKHPTLLFFTDPEAAFEFHQYSHEFISEVIELYKNQPCLWSTETKEFLDNNVKARAYEILVQKFKEVDPNANKDRVLRIIDYMKKCYFREIKKMKGLSETSFEEDVRSSQLWYFHLLHFLEIPLDDTHNSNNTEDDDNIAQKSKIVEAEAIQCTPSIFSVNGRALISNKSKSEYKNVHNLSGECMPAHHTDKLNAVQSAPGISSMNRSRPISNKSKFEYGNIHNLSGECTSTQYTDKLDAVKSSPATSSKNGRGPISNLLGECTSTQDTDKFDYLSKYWAFTLRSVEIEQQIFAEKLISEVLYEAQLSALCRDSCLCTRVNPFREFNSV